MKFRTGRKVGRTLYVQINDHPDDMDLLIGIVDTTDQANIIVTAVNAVARLRALHKPVTERRQIHTLTLCGHCQAEGAYGYAEPVEWPCPTIRAIDGSDDE